MITREDNFKYYTWRHIDPILISFWKISFIIKKMHFWPVAINNNIRFLLIGHVNENPVMRHFGNPRHAQSMTAYLILTEYTCISGNSSKNIALWYCCYHTLLHIRTLLIELTRSMVSVFTRMSSRSGDGPCPHADAENKMKVFHAYENLFYICVH